MPVVINGTTGITNNATDLNYTGTLTGGTGVVNLGSGQVFKDASGNVGIGTSSLSTTRGPLTVLMPANQNGAGIVVRAVNSGGPGSQTALTFERANATVNYSIVSDQGTGYLAISDNTSERMRLDSSGNLLVGTMGTSNTNGVLIGKGGAAGGGIVSLYKTASGSTNGLLNYYQSTYVGGINFDNTSTSFPTSSDKRLKKDISDSASATQKIDDIRIVSHGWKHDESVVDFGIIAQDLYEIMPRAVLKGDDEDEIQTVWSVDYSKLVPLLIKAHQEQQALITALTARITALEGTP